VRVNPGRDDGVCRSCAGAWTDTLTRLVERGTLSQKAESSSEEPSPATGSSVAKHRASPVMSKAYGSLHGDFGRRAFTHGGLSGTGNPSLTDRPLAGPVETLWRESWTRIFAHRAGQKKAVRDQAGMSQGRTVPTSGVASLLLKTLERPEVWRCGSPRRRPSARTPHCSAGSASPRLRVKAAEVAPAAHCQDGLCAWTSSRPYRNRSAPPRVDGFPRVTTLHRSHQWQRREVSLTRRESPAPSERVAGVSADQVLPARPSTRVLG
jgi:hypothetical protein